MEKLKFRKGNQPESVSRLYRNMCCPLGNATCGIHLCGTFPRERGVTFSGQALGSKHLADLPGSLDDYLFMPQQGIAAETPSPYTRCSTGTVHCLSPAGATTPTVSLPSSPPLHPLLSAFSTAASLTLPISSRLTHNPPQESPFSGVHSKYPVPTPAWLSRSPTRASYSVGMPRCCGDPCPSGSPCVLSWEAFSAGDRSTLWVLAAHHTQYRLPTPSPRIVAGHG